MAKGEDARVSFLLGLLDHFEFGKIIFSSAAGGIDAWTSWAVQNDSCHRVDFMPALKLTGFRCRGNRRPP